MLNFFSKLSVKYKILLPILIVFVFIVILNYFILSSNADEMIDKIALENISKFKKNLDKNIQRVSNKALLTAAVFSKFDFVKTAYEYEDETVGRDFLREKITPYLTDVYKNMNIKELRLHFHKPPAKSFLRTWRKKGVKDGGDDLSTFRKTILSVNKNKKSIVGVEPGRGGIPFRGIVPIIFDGKHLGSLEVYFNFDHLKDIMNFEKNSNVVLFIDKETLEISYKFKENKKVGEFTQITSIGKTDLNLINLDLLKKGYKKMVYKVEGDSVNVGLPIKDYNGKIFGVIYYSFDIMELTNKQKSILIIVFLSYFIVGAIIVFILLFISFRIIGKPLAESVEELDVLAKGDLTMTSTIHYEDEIGDISRSYNSIIEHLRSIVTGITQSSQDITNTTNELASSSDDLAHRTNEQAASITETSTTLEKFTAIVNQNSHNADEAGGMLKNLNDQVQQNATLIDEVSSTMTEINSSSKEINNIVSVINDISFQTNLLALNAAVEAARAGDAGRGFAVVASEVRNLAGKTAESSKSIQQIITQNVESTNKGTELVSKTAELFASIVLVMNDIVSKIKQINDGSKEQTTGINQINKAVNQLDTVINQNAALVEELSAAGKSLKGDLNELLVNISKFKL